MMYVEDITKQDIRILSQRCLEQTEQFYLRRSYDPGPGFELFRRAIVESDQNAWSHIYTLYYNQVLGWVLRHPHFAQTGENADFFVNRAFERLWRGLKPEAFENYHDLAALLEYLKRCVHSAVITMVRSNEAHLLKEALEPERTNLPEINIEDEALGHTVAKEIWCVVEEVCMSEAERAVAYATFKLGMAPRQVCARYPHLLPDTKTVNMIKRRITARLSRHPSISSLLNK